MGQVLLLSLVAAIYPTLLAAVTVMLLAPSPKRLLIGYVLGAYTMSITVGILVVFALGSSTTNSAKTTFSPAQDIVFGALFLVIAAVLGTGRDQRLAQRREARRKKPKKEGPPKWQQYLGEGSARVTFAVGALLSLPSVSYLVALGEIDKLGYPTAGTIAVIVLFNVIMFLLVELPLLGYLINPEWTQTAVERFKAWLTRSGRRAAVYGCAAVGVAMVLRGVIGALTA